MYGLVGLCIIAHVTHALMHSLNLYNDYIYYYGLGIWQMNNFPNGIYYLLLVVIEFSHLEIDYFVNQFRAKK